MRKAKIGIIQVVPYITDSVEGKIDHLLHLAEECLKEGADLVFMPETYQYSGLDRGLRKGLVKQHAANYKARCSELARAYQAYVVPWDNETTEDGRMYNTSYILDRTGKEIGRYRKSHLTYGEIENGLSRGEDLPVFDLDFGKVGVMICWDNYFPETARILALRGAELILYPLYGDTLEKQWEIKMISRAIDNSVYVAPCQIHGAPREKKITYSGMIDPTGEVIARLEQDGSWTVVEIEMGKQVATRTTARLGHYEDIKYFTFKLRNLDLYKPLLEKREYPDWSKVKWVVKEEEGGCF